MKKLLALAVCLMLMGTITVDGTLAFSFSDFFEEITTIFGGKTTATTEQINIQTSVMMRDQEGNLVAEDPKEPQMLIPLNQPTGWDATKTDTFVGGRTYKLWTQDGVIDKFIFIKNNTSATTGGKDAYFRTAISIRCSDASVWELLKINRNTVDYQWSDWGAKDGWYTSVATYTGTLAPGETAPALMMQIALEKSMTNEQMTKFGSDFSIEARTVAIDKATFVENGEQLTAVQALDKVAPIKSFQ